MITSSATCMILPTSLKALCLVLIMTCGACGQDMLAGTGMSPRILEYARGHPQTLQVLTNAFVTCFGGQRLRVFYYYRDGENCLRGAHRCESDSSVEILVQADQPVLDEYLVLLFEACNVPSESRYDGLMNRAASRDISRDDSIGEMSRLEHLAALKVKTLIAGVDFGKREEANSPYYEGFRKCPAGFKDFADHWKKVSESDDPQKLYGVLYSRIQPYH